jgi:hypothetical protein
MGLRHPTRLLEDQGLSGVQGSKIGSATGVLPEFDLQDRPGVGEGLARLIEVALGLRPQRSTPSRRISCISGVRCR